MTVPASGTIVPTSAAALDRELVNLAAAVEGERLARAHGHDPGEGPQPRENRGPVGGVFFGVQDGVGNRERDGEDRFSLRPESTCVRRQKLRIRSPAPKSRATAKAVSPSTRPRDRRRPRRPGVPERPPPSREPRRLPVACIAGSSPNARPVPIEAEQGEAENRRVQPDLGGAGHLAARQREQAVDAPAREEHAQRSAGQGQHEAFRQELSDEPGARGAEGRPDRHLPFAGAAPGEQEIRDVHAGDQKKKAHGPEQNEDRRPNVVRQSCGSGTRTARSNPVLLAGYCRANREKSAFDSGAGRFQRRAGPQAAQDLEPAHLALVGHVVFADGRQRNPGLRPPRRESGTPAASRPPPCTGCRRGDRAGRRCPGSERKRRCHRAELRTTTRLRPGRSSSGESVRPSRAGSPRVSKKLPDTVAAGTRSGSPAPVRFIPERFGKYEYAATLARSGWAATRSSTSCGEKLAPGHRRIGAHVADAHEPLGVPVGERTGTARRTPR